MLSRSKFEKAVKKIVIRSAEAEAAEAAKKESGFSGKSGGTSRCECKLPG